MRISARLRPLAAVAGSVAGLCILTGAYLPNMGSPGNLLINPSMEIDQANEGSAVTVGSAYIVDGWGTTFTSTGHSPNAAISCARDTSAPPGFVNSVTCTTTTAASAMGAGDNLTVRQKIEASQLAAGNLGTAGAVNACVSWWQKASIAGYVYSLSLRNAAATRSYVVTAAANAAPNTWTYFAECLPLDSGGTWITSGNAAGAILAFGIAVGSSQQGAPAAWSGSNILGAPSNTNTFLTTAGASFSITGVKLEVSPVPTAFQRRDPATDLNFAQRYLRKSYDVGVAPGAATDVGDLLYPNYSAGIGQAVRYPVMRCDPSVTMYSPVTGASGYVRDVTAAADAAASVTFAGMKTFEWGPASGTAGHVYTAQFLADCRL